MDSAKAELLNPEQAPDARLPSAGSTGQSGQKVQSDIHPKLLPRKERSVILLQLISVISTSKENSSWALGGTFPPNPGSQRRTGSARQREAAAEQATPLQVRGKNESLFLTGRSASWLHIYVTALSHRTVWKSDIHAKLDILIGQEILNIQETAVN